MSVPVVAASDAAAARLVVVTTGPCVSLTVSSHGSGVAGAAPVAAGGLAAAMDDALRDLRGDVRVVLVRGLHRLPGAPELPGTPEVRGTPEPPESHGPAGSREPAGSQGPVGIPRPALDASGGDLGRWTRVAHRLSERADLTSIAVLAGRTSGVGLALALACDLRVMAENSALCLPEPAHGRVPTMGVTAALVEALGYERALHLCLTGEAVPAPDAVRLGLAALAVPAAVVDAEADRLADRVLAVPREAAAETKALLRQTRGPAIARSGEAEAEALRRLAAGNPATGYLGDADSTGAATCDTSSDG
ncbi:enoyl-CoA hydratase/isomerase family protein [Frankia sp. EI5c]|uniref:enoyl-CoA hydratase/isomerase family protein n=1 Tax=Frankia sp. EI5c TaxID=683316 RepID=UPI0007C2D8DA|nr:enoyl-CoA hydratase/isomerase family protein [Frankia sp. EI5c]OAA25394.1 enoyl-CoA hydratase/isomerase family protein [Frankia sp. EI5c]